MEELVQKIRTQEPLYSEDWYIINKTIQEEYGEFLDYVPSEEDRIKEFLRILAKYKLEYLDTQDLLDILNK